MVQEVPAQKESCSDALTSPPAASSPMFAVVPSEARWTWYSGPS